MVWKGLGYAAALAVLGCGSAALAAEVQQTSQDEASIPVVTNPLTLDTSSAPAGPTSLTPIMYALDPTSAGQWLEKNHLNITGFVEAGYWVDMTNDNKANDQPTFVSFPGGFSNEVVLDQLDLTLSKSLDTTKDWDWGFTFEQGYGIDDAQIHSHGMLDNSPFPHPQQQYDIPQANVELYLGKIGTGLTITAGKVVAFLGYEVINPTGNAFYTHSYSFTFADPATNTGVWLGYTFPKLLMGQDLNLTGGISRGWNQSTSDNNGAIDGIISANAKVNDKLSWVFNTEFGPEGVLPTGPSDNSNYWVSLEAILKYQLSDELALAADGMYGDAPHSALTTIGDNAQWGGVAAYAGYKWDAHFTPNLRVEWYNDTGGLTTGTGVNANYYEATANVVVHPMPNDNWFQWLQVRPEFRFDWADQRVYGSHGAGTGTGEYSQVSFGVDAIMQF
jgi:hypothetical protein